MQVDLQLPSAFSVHDENEFFAFQHLLARMNPELRVIQVATGVHVNGGCTVFWGLVYHGQQQLAQHDIETALAEAGFDVDHNPPLGEIDLDAAEGSHSGEALLTASGSHERDAPEQACFADG
jgi:hypothetical protein